MIPFPPTPSVLSPLAGDRVGGLPDQAERGRSDGASLMNRVLPFREPMRPQTATYGPGIGATARPAGTILEPSPASEVSARS